MSEGADSGANSEERRLFLVVRVPKSGSTTLSKMVRAARPQSRSFDLPDESKLTVGSNLDEFIRHSLTRYRRLLVPYGTLSFDKAVHVIAARAQPCDIVSGHLSINAVDAPGWRLDPITLIRDPFARFLSIYNYARVGFENKSTVNQILRKDRKRIAGTQGLDQYVDYVFERRDEFSNSATRMLTGQADCESPFEYVRNRYFHFGALERLNEFAVRLSRKIGGEAKIEHANKTPRRAETEFSASSKSKVEQIFDRDLALHEAIIKHVDEGGPCGGAGG